MLNIYRSLTEVEKVLLWVAGVAIIAVVVAFGNSYDGIAAGAQVAAAVGTFVLAALAFSQVREMRESRIAQERPQVIVDVDHSKPPFVYVVLRNIGRGAAKNIRFEFSAPMELPEGANNPLIVPVHEQPYFKRGMDYLAPGAEISTLWGSMITLGDFLRGQGLHDGVTITSHYESLSGEPHKTKWTVNPLLMSDRLYTNEVGMKELVEATQAIAEIADTNAKTRKKELDVFTDIRSIHRQLYRPRLELERLQAQRSPAEQETRRRIMSVICEEWKRSDGRLESKTVYDRLVREGQEPPAYAMSELLEELKGILLIRGSLMLGRDAIAQHGNMWITYVDHDLCKTFE